MVLFIYIYMDIYIYIHMDGYIYIHIYIYTYGYDYLHICMYSIHIWIYMGEIVDNIKPGLRSSRPTINSQGCF